MLGAHVYCYINQAGGYDLGYNIKSGFVFIFALLAHLAWNVNFNH